MVATALVAGHLVSSRLAQDTGGNAPFVRGAAIGETAGLEYADVRLVEVRPAKRLLGPGSDARAVEASGVFVVAVLELTPTRAPAQFLGLFLVDDQDRLYRASIKSGCPTYPDAPTAVTVHTMACFDVPPDRLEGLRLRVARGSPDNDELRRDDLAEFDLELSASDEEEWAGTTAALRGRRGGRRPVRAAAGGDHRGPGGDVSWLRLNRWWLLALPFALAGTVAATAYNVKVFWYESGLHHRLALAERGEFVEVTAEYDDAHGPPRAPCASGSGAIGHDADLPHRGRRPRTAGRARGGVRPARLRGRPRGDPELLQRHRGGRARADGTTCRTARARRRLVCSDGQGGPSLAITKDTERGFVPEGEDRPEAWSVAPVFLLPADAEIARVLVWWENPDYVELPAP